MRITEILDNVPVKNRVVDGETKIIFDSEEIVWKPSEVKVLPKQIADWFVAKSRFKINPDTNKEWFRLVIPGHGADETPLTKELVNRPELLDRENMEPTNFDTKTGKPLHAVYVGPNEVPGVRAAEAQANVQSEQALEQEAKRELAKARRVEAGSQIEKAVAPLSEDQIENAVKEAVGR